MTNILADAILDTEVRFNSNESDAGTVRSDHEAWWLSVDRTTIVNDVTDSQFLERVDAEATFSKPANKKIKAIHKDSLGIKLGGDRKVLLQQWECVVVETDEESVHCEMFDLTNAERPIEYAEVLWSEFNEYDKPLLTEGAVFYWSVGHLRRETGQVRRFSEIRMRRVPKLSVAKKKEISGKVERLRGLFQRQK